MQKIEYHIVKTGYAPSGTRFQRLLAKEIRSGWEFIKATEERHPTSRRCKCETMLIFKRTIETEG
jgi:hypothetical protein